METIFTGMDPWVNHNYKKVKFMTYKNQSKTGSPAKVLWIAREAGSPRETPPLAQKWLANADGISLGRHPWKQKVSSQPVRLGILRQIVFPH
jgi:hypothetical protein